MSDHAKKLGPFLAMMVVANTTIGSGIYLLPASLGAVGSISIIAWLFATCGAALLCGVFAFLAVLNPRTAGLFSYIRDAFGPLAAFTSAVLYWVSCLVAAVAIALAVTGYFAVFVPWAAKPPGLPFVTVAVLWIFLAANAFGPRFVARLQSWSMPIGLAPVLLAATVGWFWFHGATFSASWNVSGQPDLAILPRATVMVFWAFLGIECAIILSVRVRNPVRDVPIGTLGGLAVCALIYIAASAAIMGILPAATLLKSTAPFADAAIPAIGATAAGAVALCALLKACSTLSGTWLVTAESAESESIAGQMRIGPPVVLAHKVSPGNLLFNGVIATLIVLASVSPTLARQFTIVTNVAVVLSLTVYGAAALALVRLSAALPQKQRVWARILGAAGTLFSGALIAASEPDLLIWSAGAIVLALVAYALLRTRRLRLQPA
jgi:arginine:agmatine antiporter